MSEAPFEISDLSSSSFEIDEGKERQRAEAAEAKDVIADGMLTQHSDTLAKLTVF